MNLNNLWQLIDKHKFSKAEISNNSVELKEEDLQSNSKKVLYKFNIVGVSNNTLVIKCPSNQEGFFDKEKGHTKICDYLIFIPNARKITVILCELKNTLNNKKKKEASQQIKSTIPLLKYILAGIKTHFNEEWEIEMYYTIIANNADMLPKEPVLPSNDQYVKEVMEGLCKDMSFNAIFGIPNSPSIPISELI